MKRIFSRFNLIFSPAALVLLTLCLLPEHAIACDHTDRPCFPPAVVGLVSGQSLRINLANMAQRGQNPVDVLAQVRLYDPQGRMIAQSEEVRIPFKHFRSLNFSRADLPFPGESATGRLPVLVEVEVRSILDIIVDLRNRHTVSASLEIIDSDGRTAIALLLPAVQKVRE